MAEPFQTQSLPVKDFSGGKTDSYIGASAEFCQDNDNLIIVEGLPRVRPGQQIYDSTYYQVPAGAQRIGALIDFNGTLLRQCLKNIYYINSGWQTLLGPTSNPVLINGTSSNYISTAKWNNHLLMSSDAFNPVMKIYSDNTSTLRAENLGLPALANSPTGAGTAGTQNFIYGFCYKRTYLVGTATFEERGPITFVSVSSVNAPNTNVVNISSIPVISNSTSNNYATTSISVEISRSTNNGTTMYVIGSVTNGTTTYADTMSDTTIQTKSLLYNQDGSLDFEQPPACKYVVQAGQITWYLNVIENGVYYPYRMRPSNINQPSAAPSSFAEDVDDEIVGGIDFNSNLIVFCKNKVYRVEGFYDPQGRGSVRKTEISNKGCVSNRSVVKTSDGVFWASIDGFYFTDGSKSLRISDHLNTSYALLVSTQTQKDRIYGTYNPINNTIKWAAMKSAGSTDNDCIWTCHLRYGIKDRMCFSTWNWRAGSASFLPTCLLYNPNDATIIRGDTRGYTIKFTDSVQTDPLIDTAIAPSSWSEETIIYDYRSSSFDFGSTRVRKWIPKIALSLKNTSNVSLSVQSNNDNGGVFKELKLIRNVSNITWGDEDVMWGDTSLYWNYVVTIDCTRRFPAKGLRCEYKQLRFTNAYIEIRNSTNSVTATTNTTLKTVTLVDATKKWPSKSVGYYISFAVDNYAREYLITAKSGATITVQDLEGKLQAITAGDWSIKGYKKGDIINVLEYVIDYSLISQTQEVYRP